MSSLDDGFGPVVAPATSPLLMRTDRRGDVLAVGASAERTFAHFSSWLQKYSRAPNSGRRNIVQSSIQCLHVAGVAALSARLWRRRCCCGGGGSALISLTKNVICISNLHLPIRRCPPSLLSLLPFPPPLSTSQIAAGARTRRRSSCLGLVRGRGRRTE